MSRSSSTPADTFIEDKLKQKLYDMMQKSRSFLAHEKHLELYNALMNSMGVYESVAKGVIPSQHKRSHDGQDPPEDREWEKRRKIRRKDVSGSSFKKSKAQKDSQRYERGDGVKEATQNEETDIKLRLKKFLEEPHEHKYKNGSVVIFGKLVRKIFNKDKVTKEDLKGDRFHHDLSKPLPLTKPPGRKRILVSYFVNHDLEYLKYGTKENRYAFSVTKIKAARYQDKGIEEMISYLWSPSIQKYNKDAELGIYHWDPPSL
uniref:Uncharacterized protein n=1 Tax=Tanacetum cinerariifolium TaxID=118510 RepID=A0A699HHV9_TANCI|nr:hypothetical protein [Tanacetum cinerariifolium]